MNDTSQDKSAFITAILVTYNETQYIERSLGSLLEQDYPADSYEIIIVDGGSTDDTLFKAQRLIDEKGKEKVLPKVKILNNPKKILSAGWNLGIQNAKGQYVVRIDAHAEAKNDFLTKNIETMKTVDAVCVGGKLKTQSDTNQGELIRDVLSSPFGVGNSSFRTSDEAGYVDTAVYGLYKKKIFDSVGYFDEKLVRNQDIEMHSRIKKQGGKFYFNPQIECIYYSRDSISKMLKQAYGNGKWNILILKNNHARLSVRHLVPLFFLMFLLGCLGLGFFNNVFWHIELVVLLLYVVLAVAASVKKASKKINIIEMPILFFLLHISYGFGSLVGVFKKVN